MGLFGRRNVAQHPLPNEVRKYVDAQIRIGFRPVADIVDLAHKLTEDGDTPPEGAIAKYADDVLATRRQQALAWAKEGDADRLARAFAHLDSLGIVARRSVASDRNAAAAAIIDQRPAETSGFTYFLEGDAESLIREPASLQLAYGALDTDPQGAAEQHNRRHCGRGARSARPERRVGRHARSGHRPDTHRVAEVASRLGRVSRIGGR